MAKTFASQHLTGTFKAPADKSISHRFIILSSMALGESTASNLLEGEDVMRTVSAMQSCSVNIEKSAGKWHVKGRGMFGLYEPSNVLYLGNSGTSARLLMGVFSPYNFKVFMSGDDSLSSRPMLRVITPLSKMGVTFHARMEKHLPLLMKGSSNLMPIEYEMPVASAQVKSAILLAGAQIRGTTTVIENELSRDHTENMLKLYGADVQTDGKKITVNGGNELHGQELSIPADPSSAAFLIAAAVLTKSSSITVQDVCINETRTGFYKALKRMGAKIEFLNVRSSCGEQIADISASYSELVAISLEPEIAPSMIDEYPILAVCASFAKGKTTLNGLKELTVKESNRLKMVEENLKLCGVDAKADYENFSLEIIGSDSLKGGHVVQTNMDHRIAMSFLIMGLRSSNGIAVDDASFIKTSFPNFFDILKQMNCNIEI